MSEQGTFKTMPNWCNNTLQITGSEADIRKFKKQAKARGTALSLAKFYPEPDYTKVKVKPTFPSIKKVKYVEPSEAWWDWRVQNWGTKWDIDAELIAEDESYLEYEFDSAWSPPISWLKKVAKDFPELQFILKYDECGMCFRGVATAKKGKVYDQCIQY